MLALGTVKSYIVHALKDDTASDHKKQNYYLSLWEHDLLSTMKPFNEGRQHTKAQEARPKNSIHTDRRKETNMQMVRVRRTT